MDIYTVSFDGTGLKRLTDTAGYDAEGSYSPDGKQIVFTSVRDGDPDIYIMEADGSNVRQIVNQPGYDGGPFFSPDGKWVIYRGDRLKADMLQLYAVSVDGKTDVQLTDNVNEVNWCPYFHPSGKFLIWSGADYTTGRGTFHLWTLDLTYPEGKLTGGKRTQVTDSRTWMCCRFQSRRRQAAVDLDTHPRQEQPTVHRRLDRRRRSVGKMTGSSRKSRNFQRAKYVVSISTITTFFASRPILRLHLL